MKKPIKISDVLSYVVLCVLIVFTVIVYLPSIMGYKCFYVTTDSMYPTLKPGYLIMAEEVPFEEIKTGDIITFRDDTSTQWCTHRVVSVNTEDRSFKTKGDNNTTSDPLRTSYKYVVGKAVMAIPGIGGIFKILNTVAARAIFGTLCVIYIAIEIEVYKNRKKKGRIRE